MELKQELLTKLKLKKQHKKQIEATVSRKPIRALFWGNRVGKTVWGAQEVARYIFGNHEYRDIELPIEVWCACPSFDQQKETTQPILQEFIPKHRIKDVTWVKKGVWGEIVIDNGCRLNFKSYEQGREKFQGVGKRLIWFDEEPPRDIWEECFVRHKAGVQLDTILTMTPVNGMTWVYDSLYLDTDNPDLCVITAGWDDNPWLLESQKEQMARGLSEDALKVRREGKFVRRVGLVCNWWDRGIHLQDVSRDTKWLVTRVIDFGWSRSKTCVLWIGRDSNDIHYVFDGIYQNELRDVELAKLIKERERNYNVVNNIADNQPERVADVISAGVECRPILHKGSPESWDEKRAEAMAVIGKIDAMTKRSRLVVSTELMGYNPEVGKRLNWFVHEIEALRWKEKKIAGEIKEAGKWDKEAVKSHHFDAMDCLSYYAIEQQRLSGRDEEEKSEDVEVPEAYNPIS